MDGKPQISHNSRGSGTPAQGRGAGVRGGVLCAAGVGGRIMGDMPTDEPYISTHLRACDVQQIGGILRAAGYTVRDLMRWLGCSRRTGYYFFGGAITDRGRWLAVAAGLDTDGDHARATQVREIAGRDIGRLPVRLAVADASVPFPERLRAAARAEKDRRVAWRIRARIKPFRAFALRLRLPVAARADMAETLEPVDDAIAALDECGASAPLAAPLAAELRAVRAELHKRGVAAVSALRDPICALVALLDGLAFAFFVRVVAAALWPH